MTRQLLLLLPPPGGFAVVPRCYVCKGVGGPDGVDGVFPCGRCLGAGWHWSDRRPPTLCPQTRARSALERPACDRRDVSCPGCGRLSISIGGAEDALCTSVWAEERAKEKGEDVAAAFARLAAAAKERGPK